MKRIASVLLSAAIIGATPFVCETYSDLGTNISVEAASVIDTPKYAYGDGSSSVYKGERLINISISWSKVRDAEQYNVYLYNFISQKYYKVYEVTENAGRLYNFAHLSDRDLAEISDYISDGKFYFAVSAVKTVRGKKVESELSKGYTGYLTIEKEAKYIKHSDNTPIYDYSIIDITSQKKKVSKLEADKAVQTVKNSKVYTNAMINNYGRDIIDKKHGSYFNAEGLIEPKGEYKYNVDLNGDGKKESFIIVSLPLAYDKMPYYVLVFKDSSGNMTVLDSFFSSGVAAMIYDYGDFRHFYYESMGGAGYQMHAALYGMKKNRIKTYLSGRMYPEKKGVYLKLARHQYGGGMFYYDRKYDEYVGVTGKKINIKKAFELDKTDELKSLHEMISGGFNYDCYVWYDKYYIFTPVDHIGYSDVYGYKDGTFGDMYDKDEYPLPFADYYDVKYYTDVIEK